MSFFFFLHNRIGPGCEGGILEGNNILEDLRTDEKEAVPLKQFPVSKIYHGQAFLAPANDILTQCLFLCKE